jgi:hypothetical protein
MVENMRLNIMLLFSLIVSHFGLLAILALALHPPTLQEPIFWRKPLIGSIFTVICVVGSIAIFFPQKCSEASHSLNKEKKVPSPRNPSNSITAIKFRGHHPDCGRFRAHVIQRNGEIACAACSGLLLGSILAVMGAIIYFFVGWDLTHAGLSLVLIGQGGIFLGFVQFKFEGYSRLVLNTWFVLGAFLILVGIDAIVENLLIDLYVVITIAFWIWTRILISQWDHMRICNSCSVSCELK